MYVDSFVISVAPPTVAGGCISLGEVHDGGFTIETFPETIEFGALLELALDEDDMAGTYEVEVVLEYSRLEGAPQASLAGGAFTIEMPEPDADWWGPRQVAQPLTFGLRFWEEFEGYLVVKVNGEEIGEKALRVLHHSVPDAMGAEDAGG